jgi:hypothetical protein
MGELDATYAAPHQVRHAAVRQVQRREREGLPHNKHEQRLDEDEIKPRHWFTRCLQTGLANGRHSKLHTTLPEASYRSVQSAPSVQTAPADALVFICRKALTVASRKAPPLVS